MINQKRVNTFVQVSLTSKRLPNKALIDINGKNSVQRIIDSLSKSKYIDHVILTFTTEPIDNPLEKWAIENDATYFRGDYLNVIGRYYSALQQYTCEYIVRVTGDCPTASFELIDNLIEAHHKAGVDYSKYNTDKLAIGMACEVISKEALKKLHQQKINFDYSEYLTYYFINNPEVFSILEIEADKKYNHPEYRLTLDYIEDLNMYQALFTTLDNLDLEVNLNNIVSTLATHPEIVELNSHIGLKYKTDQTLIDTLKRETKIKL